MVDDGSILNEIKKVLGIDEEYTVYDADVILFANSAFNTLLQLGVGPKNGFQLKDKNQKWSDYALDETVLSVKSYVWTCVRLSFDPPTNSFGISALQDQKKELEWRLNVAKDREATNG